MSTTSDIWTSVWMHFGYPRPGLSDTAYNIVGGDDDESADYVFGWYCYLVGNAYVKSGDRTGFRMMGYEDAKGMDKLAEDLVDLNYQGDTNTNI
jgi:hypothetical protein